MSHERMGKAEAELEAEIAAIHAQAEAMLCDAEATEKPPGGRRCEDPHGDRALPHPDRSLTGAETEAAQLRIELAKLRESAKNA